MFDARITETGDVMFKGRLDASQTDKANHLLSKITTSCTIDFKELEYISSAGLGTLLMNQKRLIAQGAGFTLINLNKSIKDIFMFTGFDKIFKVM